MSMFDTFNKLKKRKEGLESGSLLDELEKRKKKAPAKKKPVKMVETAPKQEKKKEKPKVDLGKPNKSGKEETFEEFKARQKREREMK